MNPEPPAPDTGNPVPKDPCPPRRKPIIGIVGGIGAGKSTVARAFEKLGCAVIDADALAHAVLRETATVAAVVARWGEAMLDDQGQIERSRLARQVFAHPADLAALNALIHPSVLRRAEQLIATYQEDSRMAAIVLDMPLLMEVGWDRRCDRVIFVQCDRPKREDHVQQKAGVKRADLEEREKVQISLDRKQARADNEIINNSDFATLVKQVTEIFTDMIK